MTCPARILIVTADMGGGHNATARALEERAHVLWPDCDVRWADTLDVMGPGIGPLFRRIYVVNVQSTPWLYEFFYSSLVRWHWFAASSKRVVGAWCGRRLQPLLDDYAPDLIFSVYPWAAPAWNGCGATPACARPPAPGCQTSPRTRSGCTATSTCTW